MQEEGLASEFTISADLSDAFARASGDYNPLHLDPVYARRTQFGGSVVHGIHLLLAALDRVAGSGVLTGLEPQECSVTFNNPVLTGVPVQLETNFERATQRLRLRGTTRQGSPAFSATFVFGPRQTIARDVIVDRFSYEHAAPQRAVFPVPGMEAAIPVRAGRAEIRALFPALAALDAAWVADLLASTRVVGMHCPGMNSIYSGCKLRARADAAVDAQLRYKVLKADERFKLIRLGIDGAHFQGTLETFFRPSAVDQPSLVDVAREIPSGSFVGQRALVVGGSRGLGELAAKIVLAGGGEATITYARGKQDALRVCSEAASLGRSCRAEQLDMDALLGGHVPDWLASGSYTHVYYFASPHIVRNADSHWDANLFRAFARFYVDAFALLVQAMQNKARGSAPLRVLYPSTVFVEQPESGFAEYAAAKAAGEALCDQLGARGGARFAKPRIPRMRTDQTSGLSNDAVEDPLPRMKDLLLAFHAES
jgi:acyl dehydratase